MKPGLIILFPGDYWIEIKTSYLLTMAGGEIYSTPTRELTDGVAVKYSS